MASSEELFCIAHLASPVWWRISVNDPRVVELEIGDQGPLRVVNPLLVSDATPVSDHLSVLPALRVSPDEVCLPVAALQFSHGDRDVETKFATVSRLLRRLRFVTGQVDAPIEAVAIADRVPAPAGEPRELAVWAAKTSVSVHIRGEFVRKASSMTQLRDAASGLAAEIPIYYELLIEAAAAANAGDYRKSVLYAAMAAESASTTVTEAAMSAALADPSTDGRLRIRAFTTSRGSTRKDPIFARLMHNAQFSTKLHELALYVLGKSILIDDEHLYYRAIALYKTRNKIAHLGAPPEEGDAYIPLDAQGARQALRCAIDVFAWFGLPAERFEIHRDFVSFPVDANAPQ